jgi:hypothetical protein
VAPLAISTADRTLQWIISAGAQAPFVIGSCAIYLCVYLLLRSSSVGETLLLAGSMVDLVFFILLIYLASFGIVSTAVVAYELNRLVDLPIGVLAIIAAAALVPFVVSIGHRQIMTTLGPALRERFFNRMMLLAMITVVTSATTGGVAMLFQISNVPRWAWVALTVFVVFWMSSLLSSLRVWFLTVRSGDRPALLRIEKQAAATR